MLLEGLRLTVAVPLLSLRVAVVLLSLEVDEGFVVVVVVVERLRVAVTLWELLLEDDDEAGLVAVVVLCLRVAVVVFFSGVCEDGLLELLMEAELRLLELLELLDAELRLLGLLTEAELRLLELLELLTEAELRLDEAELRLLELLTEAELRLPELLPLERVLVLVWVEVPRLRVCASAAGLASIVQANKAEVKIADSFIMCRFLLSPR